jgi:hypothetical protein
MRRGHRVFLALLGLMLLTQTGCLRRWQNQNPNSNSQNDPLLRRDYPPNYSPGYPQNYPPGYPPPGYQPGYPPGFQGSVGVDPNRPEVLTPQPQPMEPMPGGAIPPNASGYVPPIGALRPAEYAPMFGLRTNEEPPLAKATINEPKPKPITLPPDLLNKKSDTIAPVKVPETPPAAPVGITLFSELKEKTLATGLKPDLEGLDWLRSNKYRTVIHLRRTGHDDSADREQVERRGMKYVSIEMKPDTLTKETVEQFGKIVGDAANQPAFVYDRDGLLAGAMWYLHLRLNENTPDELAKSKAEMYGLKQAGTDEATAFWAKIQELLK